MVKCRYAECFSPSQVVKTLIISARVNHQCINGGWLAGFYIFQSRHFLYGPRVVSIWAFLGLCVLATMDVGLIGWNFAPGSIRWIWPVEWVITRMVNCRNSRGIIGLGSNRIHSPAASRTCGYRLARDGTQACGPLDTYCNRRLVPRQHFYHFSKGIYP